jgi:hypothetical protein
MPLHDLIMPSSSYVEHDREETLSESGDQNIRRKMWVKFLKVRHVQVTQIFLPVFLLLTDTMNYFVWIPALMLLGNVIEGWWFL